MQSGYSSTQQQRVSYSFNSQEGLPAKTQKGFPMQPSNQYHPPEHLANSIRAL